MNTAKNLLEQGHTLAIRLNDTVYTSNERGIKALLFFIDNKINVEGFDCADKVVGKGAAFLYILLKVRKVYASVISKCAKELLESNGINVTYDILTERIVNRDKTGFCPIEEAVMNINEPSIALDAIRIKLNSLRR